MIDLGVLFPKGCSFPQNIFLIRAALDLQSSGPSPLFMSILFVSMWLDGGMLSYEVHWWMGIPIQTLS